MNENLSNESEQNAKRVPVAPEVAFDEIQRQFFGSAGGTLGLAGTATLLFGIMQVASCVLCILAEKYLGIVAFAVAGLLSVVLGIWIRTASASLRAVGLRTDGHAALVMSAVGDIRRIFRFHAVLFFVGAAIVALVIIAVLAKQG